MSRKDISRRPLLGNQQRPDAQDSTSNNPHPTNKSTTRSERTPLLESQCAVSQSIQMTLNKSAADLQTGVSWGVAAFLLVNTALGAGMLNYPYAYNQIGGVLAAALMQVVSHHMIVYPMRYF